MDIEKLAALFEAVKVIPLRADDVLVFRMPGPVMDETVARIKDTVADLIPGRKCIVLGDGADIDVLRKE